MLSRPDESRYQASMLRAERTDAAMSLESPVSMRLSLDADELTRINDALTFQLAFAPMDAEEFKRVQTLRDRISGILADLKPRRTL